MGQFQRFLRRITTLFRSGRAEQQLQRELASHLALLEEEFRGRGMAPDEARVAARRAFGGIEQTKEMQRDARAFRWLDDARRDVGYAVRTLARTPGFTAVAVITLALGIGAVTVIYSVLRNVVLDPFPYRDSDRMVDVFVRNGRGERVRTALTIPEFLDYQEQSDVFEDVVGVANDEMHYVSDAGAERVSVVSITPNTFDFLGVSPLIGRHFGPVDAGPEAPPVTVLCHRAWVRLFAADAGVIGRTVLLDDKPWTIVGVMPPRFEWNVADFWIPTVLRRSDPNAAQTFRTFQAHLRRGVTVKQAEAQLDVIASRRAAAYPAEYPLGLRAEVITVIDHVVGQFRRTLYTLFAAVGLLLVIACCNVANMLLARATVREREISVRASLGASRGRIVRQLLVESAVLALCGAIAGCLLAYGGIDALARLMPRQGVPWETQLRLDRPVLFFALATSVLATFAFGLFPAFHAARRELVAGSHTGARGGTSTGRQNRMRSALVAAEVALSMILLLGAGLLMRSFFALAGVDLGFDSKTLYVARVAFPPGRTPSPADHYRFYLNAADRLRTARGVVSVALASAVPGAGGTRTLIQVPGMPPDEQPAAFVKLCDEQYHETVGLRLVAGRHISRADMDQGRKVAVVNEALARRYFPGGDVLGRVVRVDRLATLPQRVVDPTFEIVGLVGDVANQGIRLPASPQVYAPLTVAGVSPLFVMRTSADPETVASSVRGVVRAIDPDVAVPFSASLPALMQRNFYAQPLFSVVVLGMFATTGVLLIALGVYGVLAYTVAQKTRDIAIRMALGGERRHMLVMVLRNGLTTLSIGIAVGLAAGLGTNRLLINQLWNTSPYDPATLLAAVAVIVAIGFLACWVPAVRAMRVEPNAALRQE
jgi:putative ABC transport system permease protein